LTQYQEVVWYANPKDPAKPEVPPNVPNVPVPIPHALLSVEPTPTGDWNSKAGAVVLRFAWQDAGEPVAPPAPSVAAGGAVKPAQPLPVKAGDSVLVEDARGAGAPAAADDPSTVRLKGPAVGLKPPLRALVNLLPVSRGQTVREEVLGSGDASRPSQEFVLQKKPLTYLADPASRSGEGYGSTLRVWVDGIEWHEVPDCYG